MKDLNKQTQRVYEYLAAGNKIDPLKSWQEVGVYRLASRITDLKQAGHNIGKGWKTVKNRFGDDVKVREYWLVDVLGQAA